MTRAPSDCASKDTARAMPLPRPTTTTVLPCNVFPTNAPQRGQGLGELTQNIPSRPSGQLLRGLLRAAGFDAYWDAHPRNVAALVSERLRRRRDAGSVEPHDAGGIH